MTANKNRLRGKRNERALARRLCGERIGIMGGEDIRYGMFSVETKSRQTFSIRKYLDQAIRNAPQGKIPLLILHEHHSRRGNDMVVIRLSDWEDLHGQEETSKKNS